MTILKVDDQLRSLIPPLDNEERAQLEANLLEEGCRDPIVVWNDTIVDGHNRYEICTKNNIPFRTTSLEFESKAHVRVWMRKNQAGRRNLTPAWKIELALGNKEDLLAIGREKHAATSGPKPLSQNDKGSDVPRHNTRAEVAKTAGVSTGSVGMAEQIRKKAPELWDKAKTGDIAISAAYKKVQKEERKRDKARQTEEVKQANLINAPVTTPVQQGDVWTLGRHTLYCGDTTSNEFRSLLPAADFAFADPPYGANVDKWDTEFIWDHDYLIEVAPIVAVTPGIVSIAKLMQRTHMPYRWSTATWITNGMTRGALGFGNWIYTAIFATDDTSLHRNAQDHHRITITTSETTESDHRARKPSAYMTELITTFTKEGDTIIDPFLGSGTTLIAAEKLNRTCIAGELNPEYCASIIARWEALTEQKATKQ